MRHRKSKFAVGAIVAAAAWAAFAQPGTSPSAVSGTGLAAADVQPDAGAEAARREGRGSFPPARVGGDPQPGAPPTSPRRDLLAAAPKRIRAPRGRVPRDVRGLIAKVRKGGRLPVHSRPGGEVTGWAEDRTRLGSRTALTVYETRGRWIGVSAEDGPAGRLGWIRVQPGTLEWYRTDRRLEVDLSERRLELWAGRRLLRRATVGIGAPSTPTPRGRFGVTDRLAGADFGFWYGCCILAFSGVQPALPDGWQGGNKIAVHGTSAPATIGAASSAGCLRAADDALRSLMTELPLGARVLIRA